MRWLRQQLVSTTSCMRQGYRFTCHIECSPSDSEHRSGWEGPRLDNQSFCSNPTRCSSRRRTGLSTAPFCSSTGTVVSGVSMSVRGSGAWPVSTSRGSPNSTMTMCSIPTVNTSSMSAIDGHIYRGHLDGGPVDRVSPEDGYRHFLHGVSPDGSRLAYVQIGELADPGKLALLDPPGPPVVVDTGEGHLDGPEWSPDGKWIYFNTESFTDDTGHAQLARIPDAGGPVERLVTSDTVDWFPHISPDFQAAAYIAFPAGTRGHPADLDVEVRVVPASNWSRPIQRYPLFGGQGTINVNSWSPDSTRFAFVAYPIA